jgi:hypothetical protein
LTFAMEVQRRDRPSLASAAATLATAVAVGLTASEVWGLLPGVLLLAILAVLVRVARSASTNRPQRRPAPPLTPAWQLARAASNRWLVGVGVAALDPTAFAGARGSVRRDAVRRLPDALFGAPAPWGIATASFVRVTSLRAAPYLAAGLLAVTIGRIWGSGVGMTVLLIVQFAITLEYSKPLVEWHLNHALRRVWPFPRTLVVALATPAVAAALLVTLPAAALLGASVVGFTVLVLLPGGVLWRRLQALRADDGQLLLVSTPAGAVPVQVVNRLVAGPDVVAIAMIVLALAA